LKQASRVGGEKFRDVGCLEPVQTDDLAGRRNAIEGASRLGRTIDFNVAERAEEDKWNAGDVASDELEEKQGRYVGPMEVVDDAHERSTSRFVAQSRSLLHREREPDEIGVTAFAALDRRRVAGQLTDGCGHVVSSLGDERTEQLRPRPEWSGRTLPTARQTTRVDPSRASSAIVEASRVLPMPGSPARKIRDPRPSFALWTAPRSSSSSVRRPMNASTATSRLSSVRCR